MKGLTRLALIAVAAVGMGLAASAPSYAIHKGAGGLVCGGCHTMHNSQGSTKLDGTGLTSGAVGEGSVILLRANVAGREEIHNLCLQCHAQDGSRGTEFHAPHGKTAPKVMTELVEGGATWNDASSFNLIGAGGDFSDACSGPDVSNKYTCADNAIYLGKGHSLGEVLPTPPGSADGTVPYLTCTNCHDPHGVNSTTESTFVNNYRMLRKTPTGSGTASVSITGTSSYIGGIAGVASDFTPAVDTNSVAIWPIFKGTLDGLGTGTDHAVSNNYNVTVGNWCATCHDNWHESIDGGNVDTGDVRDWKRHPVSNLLVDSSPTSGADVTIINTLQYDAGIKIGGFGVPVARATVDQVSTTDVYYRTDNTKDRVFCLSCHFPHGGPYNDLLRWDYTSAVGAGTQTGKVVPSDDVPASGDTARGCQLCHNRGGF